MASNSFFCPSYGPMNDSKMIYILALDLFSFLRGEKDLCQRLESLVTLSLVTKEESR